MSESFRYVQPRAMTQFTYDETISSGETASHYYDNGKRGAVFQRPQKLHGYPEKQGRMYVDSIPNVARRPEINTGLEKYRYQEVPRCDPVTQSPEQNNYQAGHVNLRMNMCQQINSHPDMERNVALKETFTQIYDYEIYNPEPAVQYRCQILKSRNPEGNGKYVADNGNNYGFKYHIAENDDNVFVEDCQKFEISENYSETEETETRKRSIRPSHFGRRFHPYANDVFVRGSEEKPEDFYYVDTTDTKMDIDSEYSCTTFDESSRNGSTDCLDRQSCTSSPTSSSRTKDQNNTILPPCRICGAKASGFHYGVNSCEACKGFFRRTLKRPLVFQCTKNSKCDVKGNKRSSCRFCRYKRCLSLGMSKEAIKTGRYSHTKRTKDTIEVKRLQNSQIIADGSQLSAMLSSLISSHRLFLASTETISQDLMYQKQLEHHNILLLRKKFGNSSSLSGGDPKEHDLCVDSKSEFRHHNVTHEDDFSKSFSPSSSSTSSCLSIDSGFIDDQGPSSDVDKSILKIESSFLEEPSRSTSILDLSCKTKNDLYNRNNSQGILFDTGGKNVNAGRGDSVGRWDENGRGQIEFISCPNQAKREMPCSSKPTIVRHPDADMKTASLARGRERQCDTSHASRENLRLDAKNWDHEKGDFFHGSQKRNLGVGDKKGTNKDSVEMCSNVFKDDSEDGHEIDGQKNGVTFTFEGKKESCKSGPKFDEMSALRGERDLNMTGSSRKWKTALNMRNESETESILRAKKWVMGYIGFAKSVPGFSTLQPQDQAKLLRHAWDEVWILGAYRGYNSELGVAVMPSGKCFHSEEMAKALGKTYARLAFDIADILKGHNLTNELITLLKAICIVSPDRCSLSNRNQVDEIYWTLVSCLLHHIETTHPGERLLFPRLVSVLTSLREISESAQRNLDSSHVGDAFGCHMMSDTFTLF